MVVQSYELVLLEVTVGVVTPHFAPRYSLRDSKLLSRGRGALSSQEKPVSALSSTPKKGIRNQRAKNSIIMGSFDYNDEEKENDDSSDISVPSNVARGRTHSTNKLQQLGSFIKDKSKEHLINAIMRQADREDLMKTLGFPNRKNWVQKNIPIWFGSGGILAEYV